MGESGFQESSLAEQQQLPPERKRAIWWPWLVILGCLLLLVVLRWTRRVPEEARGERHPAVGKEVTEFALLPLTGEAKDVSVDSLRGKVTLVNFWGPWCPACIVEFPHLVEIEHHFRSNERFQFFSVSTNYDPFDETGLAERTADFLRRHKADFPTYRDPQARTTRALAAAFAIEDFGYPATMLFGPDGRVAALWIGFVLGDEKAVQRAVEATLSQAK
jgi:thiol-disulfide isomerase/thioredoxin